MMSKPAQSLHIEAEEINCNTQIGVGLKTWDKMFPRDSSVPAISSALPFLDQQPKRAGNGGSCAGGLCSLPGRNASGLAGYGEAVEVKTN